MSIFPVSARIGSGVADRAASRFQGSNSHLTRLLSRYLSTPDALFACTCVIVWFILLFLYGWQNTFPATWHWDEAGKVQQILSGEWNFYHPQLLLTTVRVAVWLFDRTPTEHSVLLAGRWCSAFFSCSAVVVFSLLAKRLCGNLAGLFALLWIGTGAFIFGLSHYFKEDPALLFGISLFCYFLIKFEEFPSALRASFLGIAAGLAGSGKYIGLTVVPLGLLAAILIAGRAGNGGGRQAAVFIATAVATFALFNLPALSEPAFFSSRFIGEILHVLTEHNGFVSPVTDTILLSHIAISCNVALASALVLLVLRRNQLMHCLGFAFLIIYPVVLLVLIQFSVVKVERYVLPVIVLIQFLGACGLADLAGSKSVLLRVASVVALLLGLAWNLWQLTETMSALRYGSRAVAAEWIRSHVPANAIIAQSRLMDLNGEGAPYAKLPQTLLALGSTAAHPMEALLDEATPLEQMRADGLQYIVVSDLYYEKFINGELQFAPGPAGQLAAKRVANLTDILANSHLLIDIPSKGTKGLFFAPRLTVYKVR
jgi:hypothetical protein